MCFESFVQKVFGILSYQQGCSEAELINFSHHEKDRYEVRSNGEVLPTNSITALHKGTKTVAR